MLPDNFDFAMIPTGSNGKADFTLKEVGMLASTIESIDYSLVSWIKEDLKLSVRTNEGFTEVPVLWQVPERAYQIKHNKDLRDDAGALKLPLISVERTGIVKDPARKGGFQANTYSDKYKGRSGRFVIAKRILQDKTRNFAVASGTRMNTAGTKQRYYPRINKKVVIQTLSVPIPVYINAEYKISIRSEYQEQMNNLITPFMGRTGQINSMLLFRNGHTYEAFIDQNFTHSNTVAALGEEMRMFTTEINIRVLGYLMGEGEDDDRPIITMEENAVEITFPREGTAAPGNPNIFGEIWDGSTPPDGGPQGSS
jgi:hypothetical protein|tara:strand:+ start:177 stop:1109 length:933 start_codon:yes stop_codon:yes gene_type:complete